MGKSLNTLLAQANGFKTGKMMADALAKTVPVVTPLHMTSAFYFPDSETVDAVFDEKEFGYIYTRCGNPTLDAAAELVAVAEGGEQAVLFSSGMAATVNTLLALLGAGDHIVSSTILYGDSVLYMRDTLSRFGIETTFVDFEDKEAFEAAFRPNTKLVITETICNPLMLVADIPAAAEMAHKHGCKLIVDNCFATPPVCRPLDLGADIVLESVTKYLCGHTDVTGGIVCGSKADMEPILRQFTQSGAIMGPFEAWLLIRSMRTLDLRMRAHSANALAVAEALEKHPKVQKVYYGALDSSPCKAVVDRDFGDGMAGGMVAFEVVGGEQGALKLIEELKDIELLASLASFVTTIIFPGNTSHRLMTPEDRARLGVSMSLLRLSVGLEDPADIIADLEQALEKI